QPRPVRRLWRMAAGSHRHRHNQRAGGSTEFSSCLADAFAGRGELSRLGRGTTAANRPASLSVLSAEPDSPHGERGRDADVFYRRLTHPLRCWIWHRRLRADGDVLYAARFVAHSPGSGGMRQAYFTLTFWTGPPRAEGSPDTKLQSANSSKLRTPTLGPPSESRAASNVSAHCDGLI